MVVLFSRPRTGSLLGVEPELASWDRAGSAGQVRLAAFLAHIDDIAGPLIADLSGPLAVELVVGLPGGVPLTSGGRDLDNYLYPVAQRMGADRIMAIFGRKVHGRPSFLAIGPAQPDPGQIVPAFTARASGSYARRQWKAEICDALRATASLLPPGAVSLDIAMTTGSGRNWANLWKPVLDSFGPVLGEDPARPFHPYDDRVTRLGLHHHIDSGLGHDVIIEAAWTQPKRPARRRSWQGP